MKIEYKDLKLEIKYKPINSIVGYVNNTRLHPQSQIDQIKSSIKEFGMCTPIGIHNGTIIYGHGRWEALKQLGYDEVPTLDLSHLTDTQRKAFTIVDNKIGDNSTFDEELLKIELQSLQEMDFDLSLTGFSDEELKDFDLDIEDKMIINDDNPYSQKVEIPTYEPDGEKPSFSEMYEDEKVLKLIDKIENSSVDNEIKQFLKLSAYRHLRFNYEKIANYYAHSNKEVQELMEDSYLVIIDFNKAIENGLINLENEISEIYNEDNIDDLFINLSPFKHSNENNKSFV